MWRFYLDAEQEKRDLWKWQFDIEKKLMLGQYANRSELQRKLLLLERARYNMGVAKSKYEEDLFDWDNGCY